MRDIVLPPSSTDKIKSSNVQKELVADGVRRKPPISVHQVLSDAIPPPPTAAPPPLVDSPASSLSPERSIRGRSGIVNDDVDAGCGSNTRPNSIVSSLEGGMVAIDDDIDDDITTTGSDSYGHDDDSSTNNEGKRL